MFPCQPRGKAPRTKRGHNDATTDEGQIRAWWGECPEANIGLATGAGLAVIDVDDEAGFDDMEAKHGDLPPTLEAVTGSGGRHMFYSCGGDELRSRNAFARGVDLKADGGYIIAAPSVHPSGGLYAWDTSDEGPSDTIAPLPAWVRAVRQASRPRIKPTTAESVTAEHTSGYGRAALKSASSIVSNAAEGTRNATLYAEACSIGRLIAGGEIVESEGREALLDAALGAGLDEAEAVRAIAGAFKAGAEEPRKGTRKPEPETRDELPTFQNGDEQEVANYLLGVIEQHGRTVADMGQLWQYDTGAGLWSDIPDDKGRRMVGDLWGARVVRGVDEDTGEVETKHWRVGKNTRVNVWNIACDDRATAGYFDQAPSSLVFEDCVMLIDEGGNLRSEAHHHRFRARVGYPFKFSRGECPRWLEALAQWFDGDDDRETKIQFLREFAGACLFGLAPKYQRAVILYGKGGNGKSTCLDAIERMFPPDAVQCVSPQVMTGHSSEYYLAQLRDARINVVRDMPSTSLLQSADFKAAVSGEPLMARPIGKDPFSFSPKAGMIFGANSLPATTDHSTGFWRRWVVVPFLRRFEVAKGTESLADTIAREELPGMVAWAVGGAAMLSRRGNYVLPASHRDAVDAWASNVNAVKAWLEDTCAVGSEKWTKAGALYQNHREWCHLNGVHPVASRKFGERLEALGVSRATRNGVRGFRCAAMAVN